MQYSVSMEGVLRSDVDQISLSWERLNIQEPPYGLQRTNNCALAFEDCLLSLHKQYNRNAYLYNLWDWECYVGKVYPFCQENKTEVSIWDFCSQCKLFKPIQKHSQMQGMCTHTCTYTKKMQLICVVLVDQPDVNLITLCDTWIQTWPFHSSVYHYTSRTKSRP